MPHHLGKSLPLMSRHLDRGCCGVWQFAEEVIANGQGSHELLRLVAKELTPEPLHLLAQVVRQGEITDPPPKGAFVRQILS